VALPLEYNLNSRNCFATQGRVKEHKRRAAAVCAVFNTCCWLEHVRVL